MAGKGEWKLKQLNLPTFDGENLDGWTYQVERFFHFYILTEEEVMELVVSL